MVGGIEKGKADFASTFAGLEVRAKKDEPLLKHAKHGRDVLEEMVKWIDGTMILIAESSDANADSDDDVLQDR